MERNQLFKISGIDFTDAVTKISRSFNIIDTENTGRDENGEMIREIVGTFFNYKVSIDSDFIPQTKYDNLYYLVSSPFKHLEYTLPFGRYQGRESTQSFLGYIAQGQDTYKPSTGQFTGLDLSIVPIVPQRYAR